MILNKIMEGALDSCYDSLKEDKEIQSYENQLYNILESLDRDVSEEIERIFSAYTAKIGNITYLQGLKEFNNLFIELKGSTEDILIEIERKHI